ncbi:MAG: glycosyltransferase involved in cell wall biosis [Myxococcaceae bacterium]|nr:glycosyltransferase involved in cell wall biosis [Myxococcaceae bacterium]
MNLPAASAHSGPVEKPIAEIRILSAVSIIIPTYKERDNLPLLISRLAALRSQHDLVLQVLIMDDDSRDGSAEWVKEYGADWVELITRSGPRGLSVAVVDGLQRARHPVLVVMDADLSHPPESIPQMMLALESGQDFVIGSRYVRGGTTDDDWGIFRWLNSRVATLLAWPLTQASDPMSGFFALRKRDFERGTKLNPIGYKIGLELIVKCALGNVGEVPIHFADRRYGVSKLTFAEQLKYLLHLRRLYFHKYVGLTRFIMFALVGASGVLVNLGALTLALRLGAPANVALACGVGLSVVSNYALNRAFTFADARRDKRGKQFATFVAIAAVGGALQLAVSSLVLRANVGLSAQLAALIGVGAAFVLNFIGNRFMVFKIEHPPHKN